MLIIIFGQIQSFSVEFNKLTLVIVNFWSCSNSYGSSVLVKFKPVFGHIDSVKLTSLILLLQIIFIICPTIITLNSKWGQVTWPNINGQSHIFYISLEILFIIMLQMSQLLTFLDILLLFWSQTSLSLTIWLMIFVQSFRVAGLFLD